MSQITNEIFGSYFDCPYKSSLLTKQIKGEKHELEEFIYNKIQQVKNTFISKINGSLYQNNFNIISVEILKKEYDYIFDARLITEEIDFSCDYLEKVESPSKLGNYSYTPIIVIPDRRNIPSKSKILISGLVSLLNNIQDSQTDKGILLHTNNSTTYVKSAIFIKEYFKTLKLIKSNTSPTIYLNKNCNVCEFYMHCYEKALQDNNLSLLRGIPKKVITTLNKKGIFTIHQYSFIFKPKKKQKYIGGAKLEYALKALALREKKTYINIIPELPKNETKIYVDIEGLNDESFYYLIGVVVEYNDQVENYTFWSDHPNNVETAFIAFLNIFKNISDYVVYHYGSYEISAIKKLNKQFNNKYSDQIESIIKNSFNILSLFSSHIYPPTYANGLKEIANCIGFKWTSDNAFGLQSIVWRKKWELNKDEAFKQLLITYNQEDCFALKFVTDWINKIEISNCENCINVNSIKIETHLKWGKQKFLIPELETINDYSYFDYQRSKIFLRTIKSIQKAKKRKQKVRKIEDKVNKEIYHIPVNCPKCDNNEFYTHNNRIRALVIDIKFTENGIKKWVIQLPSSSYECSNCNFIFGFNKYGRNLMIWVVNQYVTYLTGIPKIVNMLQEYFNIKVDENYLYNFKTDLAKEYITTYNEIKKTIISGNLIHIDESKTPVKGISNGYVWVLTNMDTVYYFYTHNREAGFLIDMFKDFMGVLVSDFFAGYYALSCQQQKCLVHLIRDLNNDLLINQFNIEYKEFVVSFGKLLKMIIETTDKHGLQKKYLQKHQKDIDEFYEKVINQEYETDLTIAYKKRFIRNKAKLFTFINYDNVPWNNNNAENAIKPLAKYRSRAKGILNEKGLKDYLILLSIQQTCKYRGISFLEFLKSKKKSFKDYD